MTKSRIEPQPPWIDSEATVTSCRFQFARMNTLTLGIQTQQKFRITFDYYAHGRLYSDEFQSPTAIPQSQTIPLTYNPVAPEQNSLTSGPAARPSRSPILVVGVIGSIVLSLAWLIVLRSCN